MSVATTNVLATIPTDAMCPLGALIGADATAQSVIGSGDRPAPRLRDFARGRLPRRIVGANMKLVYPVFPPRSTCRQAELRMDVLLSGSGQTRAHRVVKPRREHRFDDLCV